MVEPIIQSFKPLNHWNMDQIGAHITWLKLNEVHALRPYTTSCLETINFECDIMDFHPRMIVPSIFTFYLLNAYEEIIAALQNACKTTTLENIYQFFLLYLGFFLAIEMYSNHARSSKNTDGNGTRSCPLSCNRKLHENKWLIDQKFTSNKTKQWLFMLD